MLDAPPKTVTEHCINQVSSSAVDIDAVLAQWPLSIPQGWEWIPAFGFDCPAERPEISSFIKAESTSILIYGLLEYGTRTVPLGLGFSLLCSTAFPGDFNRLATADGERKKCHFG